MALVVLTNTFISLADADSYFSTRYGASQHWDGLTNKEKESALVTAYRNFVDSGLFSLPTAAENITTVLKNAQCEQALFLVINGDDIDARMGLQAQGVTKSGVTKEDYSGLASMQMPMSPIAIKMLRDSILEADIFGADLERNDDEDV